MEYKMLNLRDNSKSLKDFKSYREKKLDHLKRKNKLVL